MTNQVQLGAHGPKVYPVALGCMGMGKGSWYGASDDAEGIATIHTAIERGVNIIDTGDFYGMGYNELLVSKALEGKREKVLLSVKYGAQRAPDGSFLGVDNSPKATKTSLAYSLARLGVDHIDIYRPARLDPNVPIEDTIGALADMVKAGYIRYIALSEVGAEIVRRAAKVHPIVDLQIEYSLITRDPEQEIMPALAEHGAGMTAYGVFSRGLLTGSKPRAGDTRSHLPRFANADKNAHLVEALAQLAKKRGLTSGQLALAWVRAKGAALGVTVVPTIGARTRQQIVDALDGADVTLSREDLAELEAAVPAGEVAGSRYPAAMMPKHQ